MFEKELEQAAVAKRKLDAAQSEYDTLMKPVRAYVTEYAEPVSGFGFSVTHAKGSESVSIDLKKLKVCEPDLYDELLRDYPKTTVRKPTAKVVFNG